VNDRNDGIIMDVGLETIVNEFATAQVNIIAVTHLIGCEIWKGEWYSIE
jgi:hypothetical protein